MEPDCRYAGECEMEPDWCGDCLCFGCEDQNCDYCEDSEDGEDYG